MSTTMKRFVEGFLTYSLMMFVLYFVIVLVYVSLRFLGVDMSFVAPYLKPAQITMLLHIGFCLVLVPMTW